MEQDAVIGGDFLAFIVIATRCLRVAATQVARRQYGNRANFIQHGLRS